jgi:hypothetical protein
VRQRGVGLPASFVDGEHEPDAMRVDERVAAETKAHRPHGAAGETQGARGRRVCALVLPSIDDGGASRRFREV